PLASAIIVFVGIAGKHATTVEHQLEPVLAHVHAQHHAIGPRDLGVLARHGDTSADIVRAMHVDGVVAGALIESGGSVTLRMVVYDGAGALKSLGETPLARRKLSKDELDVIGENVSDELSSLTPSAPAPGPAPSRAPEPEIEMDEPAKPAAKSP